jgi:uncharacterized protein (DUF2147 family)
MSLAKSANTYCAARAVPSVLGSLAALAVSLLLGVLPAFAAEIASPLGRWQMIDDETNTPRGIVEVTQVNGELQGRFVEAYPRRGEDPNAVCFKCEGERKDKPIVGMVILWGLEPTGADWSGGHILDPTKGKVYQATLTLIEGGDKVRVRGFIGLSLFGRTQTWVRLP